jgi:hypothetical protein
MILNLYESGGALDSLFERGRFYGFHPADPQREAMLIALDTDGDFFGDFLEPG